MLVKGLVVVGGVMFERFSFSGSGRLSVQHAVPGMFCGWMA